MAECCSYSSERASSQCMIPVFSPSIPPRRTPVRMTQQHDSTDVPAPMLTLLVRWNRHGRASVKRAPSTAAMPSPTERMAARSVSEHHRREEVELKETLKVRSNYQRVGRWTRAACMLPFYPPPPRGAGCWFAVNLLLLFWPVGDGCPPWSLAFQRRRRAG